ncbi:hypothetical protein PkoCFBP13504_29090 [Pseudomonas koreensis]|nr:hypothetical protein PkoCFBP13504_29090 [Pseudomonas koreensis]
MVPFCWAGTPAFEKGTRCKSETARGPSHSNGYAPKTHGPNKRSKDRSLRQLLQKRFEGAEAAQKKRPEPVGAFSRGCGLGFTAV